MNPATSLTSYPPEEDSVTSYLLVCACIVSSTVLGLCLSPVARLEDLAMIHVVGIVLLSLRSSIPLALGGTVAMILTFDYSFVPPSFGFAASELAHASTLGGMLMVGSVVSVLRRRQRRAAFAARQVAHRSRLTAETERLRSALLSPNVAGTAGGSGRGLTICRAIVTAHAGVIAIEGREGGGASVEFTLPVLSEASARLEAGVSAP